MFSTTHKAKDLLISSNIIAAISTCLLSSDVLGERKRPKTSLAPELNLPIAIMATFEKGFAVGVV